MRIDTRNDFSSAERELIKIFRSLDESERDTVIAFVQFLGSRSGSAATEAPALLEPESIPRPDQESVVGAIKRLSRSYFMLDRRLMLNDTSSLMGAHVLQGRPAPDVIDELESLFAREYEKYREETSQGGR